MYDIGRAGLLALGLLVCACGGSTPDAETAADKQANAALKDQSLALDGLYGPVLYDQVCDAGFRMATQSYGDAFKCGIEHVETDRNIYGLRDPYKTVGLVRVSTPQGTAVYLTVATQNGWFVTRGAVVDHQPGGVTPGEGLDPVGIRYTSEPAAPDLVLVGFRPHEDARTIQTLGCVVDTHNQPMCTGLVAQHEDDVWKLREYGLDREHRRLVRPGAW